MTMVSRGSFCPGQARLKQVWAVMAIHLAILENMTHKGVDAVWLFQHRCCKSALKSGQRDHQPLGVLLLTLSSVIALSRVQPQSFTRA